MLAQDYAHQSGLESNDRAILGVRATAQCDGHATRVDAIVDFHSGAPLSDSLRRKQQRVTYQ
jgi:hypothetical protein